MQQSLLTSMLPKISGRFTKRIISFQKNSGFLILISILFLTTAQLTAHAQLSFQPPVNYPTGNGPSSSVTADFNKDGKLDIAVTNSNSSSVSVLLGRGDGTFNSAVSYGGLDYDPVGLIASDFNGDGKLDLATANIAGTVSILLGNGDGTFSSARNFTAVSGTVGIASADFNGDGKLDIAVTDQENARILILQGNGDGTFGSPYSVTTGGTNFDVIAGDFNGDGKADIATANSDANSISVLLGKGDGTFGSPVNYVAGDSPYDVAIADVNGDGKMDIISGNYGGGNVSVLLANGDGTFKPAAIFGVGIGNGVYGVTIADFNLDGKPDIASANGNNNSLSILPGNGDGTFGSPVLLASGPYPYATPVAGDFNRDGKPDLANSNNGSNNISVFLNSSLLCTTTALTGQPQNATVCSGSTATFTVAASGTNLIYKWYQGSNSARTSNNSNTLTITNAQPSDSGSYTVKVIGNCGIVTSSAATLTVNTAPKITTQPADVTVCTGSTATFSIAVSGTPAPTIQWQYSTNSGASWTNIGDNSSTVSISNTTTAMSGIYKLRAQVSNTCGTITSNVATLTVNSAATPAVNVSDNCGSSTLSTTATGTLLWSTGETTPFITVSNAGTYTVTQTVNGCTSAQGSGTAAPKAIPAAPTVTDVDNCGSSTFSTTASGTLLWSTGETTQSITVSNAGTYTVTQTVNGCASAAGSGVATPNAIPSAPVVTVANNCGSSTLSTIATGTLLWSTGETTPSITVSNAGYYSVTQTISGCTSAQGSGTAAPKAIPSAPVVTVANNCGYSTLSTTAIGTLLWSTGATTPSITVTNAGNYTVTQTVGSCTSSAGSGTASPNAIPSTPVVTVTNNCGSSTLSTTATGTLLWNTGETTSSITVSNAGNYTVIQTVNGCTSAAGSGTAAPNAIPSAPVVTVANNCGYSTLSTTATGTLLWSTGATTPSITVTNAGNYIVTQMVNGCTSAAGSGTASPIAVPSAPVVTVTNNCGSSTLSTTTTGTLLWSTGATTASITVSNAGSYSVTQRVNGCTSAAGSGTAAPNAIPSAPVVTVTNNCGSSTLSTTATGTLLWSTGETTSSITVSNAGNYTVTQTVNGCTSAAGSGTAAPNAIPSTPVVTVANNCGAATLSTTATGTLLWSTGATTASINVNNAGTYTVTQTVNGCTSAAGAGTAAPIAIPSTPAVTVTNNCGSSTLSTTATGTLLWSTGATSPSITIGNPGNYTVTQTLNGCTSAAGAGTAAPVAIPSTPVITVTNNCGASILSTTATGALLWSTGATTPSITVSNAGNYTVTQMVNGCTGNSGSGTAAPKTIPSRPVVTANGSTNFCNGGSVTLSAPAGFSSYTWSNNATTQTITVTLTGSYSVVVTNAAGCSSPASGAITVTVGIDTQKPVITCPAAVTLCYDASESYAITPLQATDNCSIASVSYAITGATTRSGSGVNASGKFNSGTNIVTWTVKDGNGNTSTCQANVTVYEKFTLTVPDSWALGSGCTLNTVYIGYTPASYILLIAIPSGGKAPFTYKWSNGSTYPFILVNPAVATTYTVTVKDARGCTQTATKLISVVDVRCGTKMDKVTLCYKGNTLCADQKDVAGYLLHGAYLGNCKGSTAGSREANQLAPKEMKDESDLTMKASPNPSVNFFKLTVNSSNLTDRISIVIIDEVGRGVEIKTAIAGETVQVGDHYRAGVYFAQAIQGNKRVTLKLIKQTW